MRSHSLRRLLLAILAASAVAPYISTYVLCLDNLWALPPSANWPSPSVPTVLWGAVGISWLGLGLGFFGACVVLAPTLALAEFLDPVGGRLVRFLCAGLLAAGLACGGSALLAANDPKGAPSLLSGAWAVWELMIKPHHPLGLAAPFIGGLAAGAVASLVAAPNRESWRF